MVTCHCQMSVVVNFCSSRPKCFKCLPIVLMLLIMNILQNHTWRSLSQIMSKPYPVLNRFVCGSDRINWISHTIQYSIQYRIWVNSHRLYSVMHPNIIRPNCTLSLFFLLHSIVVLHYCVQPNNFQDSVVRVTDVLFHSLHHKLCPQV